MNHFVRDKVLGISLLVCVNNIARVSSDTVKSDVLRWIHRRHLKCCINLKLLGRFPDNNLNLKHLKGIVGWRYSEAIFVAVGTIICEIETDAPVAGFAPSHVKTFFTIIDH